MKRSLFSEKTDKKRSKNGKMSETKTAPPLRLSSIKAARKSIARLVQERHEGKIDEAVYRAVIFGMQTLISAFRVEHEIGIAADLERRIEQLEDTSK